jgi:hypothetical protein
MTQVGMSYLSKGPFTHAMCLAFSLSDAILVLKIPSFQIAIASSSNKYPVNTA